VEKIIVDDADSDYGTNTACLLPVLATLSHFASACPRYSLSLLVSLPSNAEMVLL
jgi:hypothetical protein